MIEKYRPSKAAWKELIFQLVLHLLVFIFYSFDRAKPQIELHQVVFFLNYAFIAFLINYILLPRFYYKKQYISFLISFFAIIVVAIFIEEFILEKIYFPNTKGKFFSPIFYTLLDVLPVITILSGFKFAWDALGKQREVDALKAMVRDSELQFLKTQINPHFLFNNLNNLYAYVIEKSPKAPEIILELSGVLRYMLYECKEDFVPLSKEVEQLKNFIKISELQIEDRGRVNFQIENIKSGYQIAPLILIVFIENAFKHSTASQSQGIEIDIKIGLSENGRLEFLCRNSYQIQSNTEQLSKGIGLENVRKRLELLYPNNHKLEVNIADNLFKVRLFIDLK